VDLAAGEVVACVVVDEDGEADVAEVVEGFKRGSLAVLVGVVAVRECCRRRETAILLLRIISWTPGGLDTGHVLHVLRQTILS
jgi:hypothetical protein